jgi:hypothetical protein
MYHILNFYAIVFSNSLSKKINFKMVKCEMIILIEREKTDVADTNVVVD